MRRGSAALLLLVLGGCALGPDYERPELDTPDGWIRPVDEGESLANAPWWELFDDPELQALIRTALEENQDLAIAASRIEEFRAALTITRANQFPTIDLSGSAGQTSPSRNNFPGNIPGLVQDDIEAYSLSADLLFEVDLFGRLRRATEAARGELLAQEENRRAVTISLVSNVANTYMTLRDLDARFEISRRTEAARIESLNIIQARFDKGTVPLIDVNQAEIQLAIAQAAVAAAERAVTQTENLLSTLLGGNPGPITRGKALTEQVLPPAIPAGLPSELLMRRPDVLSTEAQLAAQTARIGVAQAARWPSLSLTGSLGIESQELSTLTDSDSGTWQIGAGILQPLFNSGRLSARVEVERQRTEQLVQTYEQTVQRAFREVEDALVAVRTYRAEYEARSFQVRAAKSAAVLSKARYDGGVTSYLEVLDTERSLFDAELSESSSLRLYLTSVIDLYRALGGGWSPEDESGP
ncbi:MAG: efflux transporter outer membrane subunit [Pseudomonadota bacterium]